MQPLGPVVVDLASTELLSDEVAKLQHPQTGGLILFARNYDSPKQLQNLVSSIRQCRSNILIMVDQEGGRVQRFKSGFTRLPPLKAIGDSYSYDKTSALALAYSHAWVMAVELLSVGVDLSLAPILDCDDCHSDVIGDRSFSPDPNVVAELARVYIQGMNDAGMQATAKHFPGHGAVKEDSHKSLPVDTRTFEQMSSSDMLPFVKNINKYAAVMPAHILFSRVCENPVGYSTHWLSNILRKQLGFNGIIFSDDLSMEGAAVAGDFCARAIKAYEAGCDGLLVCNHPTQAEAVLSCFEQSKFVPNNKLSSLVGDKSRAADLIGSVEYKRHEEALATLAS